MATAGIARDLDEVRRIVLHGLAGHRVRVFLFGSRSAGGAVRSSDIDVGVLPLDPLPAGVLFGIREALENSSVLPMVDLVDLSQVDAEFRERVLRDGTPWTS
jgi:predicted nucleotidyltransferase